MPDITNSTSFPIVLVSGLSGSGKSSALDVFEDIGFFKIDGVPPFLLQHLIKDLSETVATEYCGLVLGVDLRQPTFILEYKNTLQQIKENRVPVNVLFFEAKISNLVHRYAATRRPHPLEKEKLGLEQALELERERLQVARDSADLVLDTSAYSIHDLRRVLQSKWKALQKTSAPSLRIHVISFGFKYGTPTEADMVFDLRFLPNPYFDPALRPLSGQNEQVAQYVLESDAGKAFQEHFLTFLHFVLNQMEREGRFRLTLGIGCTGGRHRSVAVAEALAKELTGKEYSFSLEHRHLALG